MTEQSEKIKELKKEYGKSRNEYVKISKFLSRFALKCDKAWEKMGKAWEKLNEAEIARIKGARK